MIIIHKVEYIAHRTFEHERWKENKNHNRKEKHDICKIGRVQIVEEFLKMPN